jgi:hypothetical protein
MIDARVDAFGSQQPMQKLPADARQISAGLDRRHEPFWPCLGFIVWEPFENRIFKSCQHDRDAEPRFVLHVVAAVERATDSAALATFPIFALDDFIGLAVLRELRKNFSLDRFVVEICEHGRSQMLKFWELRPGA